MFGRRTDDSFWMRWWAWAGRQIERKAFDRVLLAFPEVLTCFTEAKLNVVGRGTVAVLGRPFGSWGAYRLHLLHPKRTYLLPFSITVSCSSCPTASWKMEIQRVVQRFSWRQLPINRTSEV